MMPAEIVTLSFCADYTGQFEVVGSKGDIYEVTWGDIGSAHCTCPAFEYSKGAVRHCKHIDQVFKQGCFYNPQWYDGGTRELKPVRITPSVVPGESCPKCNGPMISVRCAV